MPSKGRRDVPGPRGVAAQWRMFRDRYGHGDIFLEISRRHGDVAWLPYPGLTTVLLSHPDDVHAVLASKAHYFRIFGQDMLRRVTPWGLVATEGQVHDENRTRMMLAMRKILARRVPQEAARSCRLHVADMRDGDVVDVARLARGVTLGVACSILAPPDDESPRARLDDAEVATLISSNSPWMLRFPSALQWASFLLDLPRTIRKLAILRRARRQVRDSIERARGRPAGDAPADMLSLLIDGSETGGPMPGEFLADNLLNMLLAGYETSGNSLAWALWATAGDRSLQDTIAAEGMTLPDDPARHETWMNDAHWTDATLRETLRLYPSVWLLCRASVSDYRVGDYLLPGGTVFVTSPWVTQRDPRWFSDPLRFDPARWEDERTRSIVTAAGGGQTAAKRPPFAYFPFGGGNRFCIGKATFEFEGSMLLAAFYRDWIAEPVPGCEPRPKFCPTMRPDGPMWVRVRRRG